MVEEQGVFWLGGQPGTDKGQKHLADSEAFVARMNEACETEGCEVQRFVSAQGAYGTWLLEFRRDGKNQRVVWNGKDERLVLQVALGHGGWEEPKAMSIANKDQDGFAAGLKTILGRDTDENL